MSRKSLEDRAVKMIARQEVATRLGRQQAILAGGVNQIAGDLQRFFSRGFFGRLKWLLFGK